MSSNDKGNNGNGNGHQSAMPSGVVANTSPYRSSGVRGQQDGDDYFDDDILFETVEADQPPTEPVDERRANGRRKKVIAGMMIMTLIVVVGTVVYLRLTRKTRIDYRVQEQPRREAGAAPTGVSNNGDNTTRQAVADAQSSIMNAPSGMTETSPTSSATTMGSVTPGASPRVASIASPLILPDVAGTVTTPPTTVKAEEATTTGRDAETTATTSTSAGGTTRTSQTRAAGNIPSRRNSERSIFMTEADVSPVNTLVRASLPTAPRASLRGAKGVREEQPTAVKPPFGSMLPVRTLGAIYTLRSGALVRMELTRNVAGDGWSMRRGTVLVGTLRGSEYDRAYLTLVGFIDPANGCLVKIGGDVLGADGGAGLKGKRRRVDSRWARVLGQAATSAIGVTQSLLAGRGGGTTIIMPTAQSALSPELSGITRQGNRREFIEIAAGASGYIMVTDLPHEIKGVDALTQMDENELAQAIDDTGTGLSETELAELLASGSPEQIRAAMPRMTVEMRRIAQAVLNEQAR